ncbi:MAG: TIGR02300 family protein [Methylocystis sp.]|nr:MAG: TIGR02300 family protein [Methylocystis sp.]
MAKPEFGSKRQCQSCATKFYDFNKSPITCPKCGAIFQVAALSRAPARVEEEDTEVEKESVDTVSLDEVEESENAAETIDVDEDVEIDDAADDDTFLEEEEGDDDDVSGLIDGDIESDDEV